MCISLIPFFCKQGDISKIVVPEALCDKSRCEIQIVAIQSELEEIFLVQLGVICSFLVHICT